MEILQLFATTATESSPSDGPIALMVLATIAVTIVGMWKVLAKAGQPGWAMLVPFYNMIVVLRMAGRPWQWIFLLLIPFVSTITSLFVSIDIAKAFGRSATFGVVGLWIFAPVGAMILGYGDSTYSRPHRPGSGSSTKPKAKPKAKPSSTSRHGAVSRKRSFSSAKVNSEE